MNACALRICASLVLVAACSDPATPDLPPGIAFNAPADLRDTIEAVVPSPVTVTLTGEDRRPLAHTTVSIEARNGIPFRTIAVDSPGSLFHPGFYTETTDARGRVTTYLRLGPAAGAGYVVVRGSGFADSLRFDVLPGAMAGVAAVPADTSLGVGATYVLAARGIDRRGNLRPEPVMSFSAESLTPQIVTVQGSNVSTQSIGRAVLRITAASHQSEAFVSIPPQAR
jgi:hypothetical protein